MGGEEQATRDSRRVAKLRQELREGSGGEELREKLFSKSINKGENGRKSGERGTPASPTPVSLPLTVFSPLESPTGIRRRLQVAPS
ncbi:hypothetical protein ACLOJK_026498 [Asimina triloba]